MKFLVAFSLVLNIYLVSRSPRTITVHDQVQLKQSSTKKMHSPIKTKTVLKKSECPTPSENTNMETMSDQEWGEKVLDIQVRFENELEEFFHQRSIEISKLTKYRSIKQEFDTKYAELWSDENNAEGFFSPYRDKASASLRVKYTEKMERALGEEDFRLVTEFIQSFNKDQVEKQKIDPSIPVILIGI